MLELPSNQNHRNLLDWEFNSFFLELPTFASSPKSMAIRHLSFDTRGRRGHSHDTVTNCISTVQHGSSRGRHKRSEGAMTALSQSITASSCHACKSAKECKTKLYSGTRWDILGLCISRSKNIQGIKVIAPSRAGLVVCL